VGKPRSETALEVRSSPSISPVLSVTVVAAYRPESINLVLSAIVAEVLLNAALPIAQVILPYVTVAAALSTESIKTALSVTGPALESERQIAVNPLCSRHASQMCRPLLV